MKHPSWLLAAVTGLTLVLAGCGHLDLTPETDPNRVVTGTVNVRMSLIPPADSELVVRVVQPPDLNAAPTRATQDMVIGERGVRVDPERVISQQVIKAPSGVPIAFRVEFKATDAEVRRGLNLEARLSWGGRLRFRNVEAVLLNPSALDRPIELWVEPVQ